MATKYFCDKCGEEIKDQPKNRLTLKEGNFTKIDKDLCDSCVSKFNFWLSDGGSITFYGYHGGNLITVPNNQQPYTITSDNRNMLNCIGNPTVPCNGPSFTTP